MGVRRRRLLSLAGSALFLVIAPGTVAGLLPWLITRHEMPAAAGAASWAGAALIIGGLAILLDCFVRFAWIGLGTPAPIARTQSLVISGFYRHVRNPMYVGVLAAVLGQALLFGSGPLLLYALAAWLVFHLFVTLYEEPVLRRQYGEDYARYAAAVPRWLPRLNRWRG